MLKKHRQAFDAVQASSDPVVVFQMGKVGSSSIYRALRHQRPDDVFHVHRMNPAKIAPLGDFSAYHEYVGLAVFHHLVVPRQRFKVITCVRDPIARNVSAFFYNDHPDRTVEHFIDGGYPHQVPLRWFDEQFAPGIGVDVFEHPFDQQAGWSVIDHPLRPTLVIRAETPDDVKAQAVQDFTGVTVDLSERENTAADKDYVDDYRRFKADLGMPDDLLDRMLNSKLVRHFYTDEERNSMWARWGV